jgi:hypothetical protein
MLAVTHSELLLRDLFSLIKSLLLLLLLSVFTALHDTLNSKLTIIRLFTSVTNLGIFVKYNFPSIMF